MVSEIWESEIGTYVAKKTPAVATEAKLESREVTNRRSRHVRKYGRSLAVSFNPSRRKATKLLLATRTRATLPLLIIKLVLIALRVPRLNMKS